MKVITLGILLGLAIGLSACSTPVVQLPCMNVRLDHDSRMAACTQAIESHAYSGETLVRLYSNRGAYHIEAREYEAAVEDFTAALAISPTDRIVLTNRPIAYRHLGKYDLALADLDRAAPLYPHDKVVFTNRGLIHRDRGEYQLAVDDFTQALTLSPDDGGSLYQRAYLFLLLDRVDEAVADYTRLLAVYPSTANVYGWRGDAETRGGKFEAAQDDYTRALAASPKNGFAYAGRCFVRAHLRAWEEGVADCDAAEKTNIDPQYVHDARGYLYLKMTRFAESIAEYSKTIAQDPKVAEAFLGRAMAERSSGDPKKAKIDLDQAISLDSKIENRFDRVLDGPSSAGTDTKFRIEKNY